jgi:hypothetical protein
MDDELSFNDTEFSHIHSFVHLNNDRTKAVRYGLDTNVSYFTVFSLFIFTYLWTLAMTAIPLLVEVKPSDYYVHNNWYTGNDIMRLIEPIGGFMLNFMVFQNSGIFRRETNKSSVTCIFVFFFGAALYGQGAGFHTASNMFKNSLETIDNNDRLMSDLAYYMRTIWEHIISHYMYAAGYAIMSGCHAFAYKDHKSSQLGLSKSAKSMLVLTSIVYALLIAGVAADFPSGTIVALIYLCTYGLCVIGGYLLYLYKYDKETNALAFGSRPVLHQFFLSYCFGLILLIAWICHVGGFKSRTQSGY